MRRVVLVGLLALVCSAVAQAADHSGLTFSPAAAHVGDVITIHGDLTRDIHRVFVGCRRPDLPNQPCDNVKVWTKLDDHTLLATVPVGAHDGRVLVKFVGDRVDSSKKSLKID